MRIINLESRRRVVFGRNVTLTAGIIYALSRAAYYVTVPQSHLSPAQSVATADGNALGMWAALWGLAAVLCVVDMANGHTRYGLSLVTGIAFAWGIGYLIMWGVSGFHDLSLLSSAIGWATPALLIFGFLIKVTALQDMLRSQESGPGGD